MDAYKEWLLLVHEEKKPTGAENGAGAAEPSEPPLPLLPQHARLLLQRLAAFFHDEAMTSLWVLAAKTVMEFTRPPGLRLPSEFPRTSSVRAPFG